MDRIYIQDELRIIKCKWDKEKEISWDKSKTTKQENIIYQKDSSISNDGKLLSNLTGQVLTFCFLTHGEKFEFGYYKDGEAFIEILPQMLEIDR
jgi:hypothetical protein